MEFLQPILLWGLLGLSIPIAIHLWNGKKGNQISWAAMAWLSEQENQSSKSIRLDQFLVLLLRILMIILLVLLLSHLILRSWALSEDLKIVHLVAPEKQVFEEFRFELEQANEKGEEVFWLEPGISDISNDINSDWLSSDQIQKTLNNLPLPISKLNLYLPNSQDFLPEKLIINPVKPIIHLAKTSKIKAFNSTIELDSSRVLELDEFGVLTVSESGSTNEVIAEMKNLRYYLGDLNEEEKTNVKSALKSISSVMKIKLEKVDELSQAKVIFDVIYPETIDSDKLYFLSGSSGFPHVSNVLLISEKLNFESSEMVRNGQLPEFILRELIKFSGVKPIEVEVTKNQIASRFLITEEENQNKKSGLEILLVGLFVFTFGLERFFSNQRGV
jgi:hypothetical protein